MAALAILSCMTGRSRLPRVAGIATSTPPATRATARMLASGPSSSPQPKPAVALPNGFLVVDKPSNWTSSDVVGKVRGTLEKHFRAYGHSFRRRSRLKVGHGGTLDPLATGLLVLGVGSGTKQLQQYLKGAKSYVAKAQLGIETDTQDSEGNAIVSTPYDHVSRAALEEAARGMTGQIMQRAPIYSARSIGGKRMYELARAGEITPDDVEAKPVTVYEMSVCSFDSDAGTFDLAVKCSGGTYIRSLITDIGRSVQSSAHMTALERTRHGPFCSREEAANDTPSRSAGIEPVTLEHFGNAARLLQALEEAGQALDGLANTDGEDSDLV